MVDFHGDWHKLIDAYISDDLGKDGWSKIWPGNPWYKPYQDASVGVPVYFPNLSIGGQGFGGGGFYWNQKPAGEASNVRRASPAMTGASGAQFDMNSNRCGSRAMRITSGSISKNVQCSLPLR